MAMSAERQPVLVIAGPTASGKTAASLALARRISMEVISADARQVYRRLDIGTAKPTAEERAACPHHCIDILDPDRSYSAADYARDVRSVLARPQFQPASLPFALPVLVGGSGLYIAAALDGFSHNTAPVEPELRATLKEELARVGRDAMWQRLQDVDPRAAEKYADKNPRRVLRALEFHASMGKPFSSTWDQQRDAAHVDALYIFLSPPRDVLATRIEERCREMYVKGIVEETEAVLASGVDKQSQALRTVGYVDVIAMLEGLIDRDEAIGRTIIATRQYAKRQRTWFARDERYVRIENDPNDVERTVESILLLVARRWPTLDFVD
jgi:tRNA dimethylallyltransferase